MVEDTSKLPDGWKQYTGEVTYTNEGASFTNPITGESRSDDSKTGNHIIKGDNEDDYFGSNEAKAQRPSVYG